MKTSAIAKFIIALLLIPFLTAYLFGQEANKKVVAVLTPVSIYVHEPPEDDKLGREFRKVLLKELRSRRQFIIITSPTASREAEFILSVIEVFCGTKHVNISHGYAAALTMVTRQDNQLRVDVSNTTAKDMQIAAKIVVDKFTKTLYGEDNQ